jgi:hypothetical protein
MAFVDGQSVAILTPIHITSPDGMEYTSIRIDHVRSVVDAQRVLATRFDETPEGLSTTIPVPVTQSGR